VLAGIRLGACRVRNLARYTCCLGQALYDCGIAACARTAGSAWNAILLQTGGRLNSCGVVDSIFGHISGPKLCIL